MEKRVSFEVAKAIKEAGYPQENTAPCYVIENCTKQYNIETITKEIRLRIKRYKEGDYIKELSFSDERCEPPVCYAPTYIEVWLWLWREKDIRIQLIKYAESAVAKEGGIIFKTEDPEESIIAAIEYLVKYNLIK